MKKDPSVSTSWPAFDLLIIAFLSRVRESLKPVFICIFLIKDAEHFLQYLLTICISSLGNYCSLVYFQLNDLGFGCSLVQCVVLNYRSPFWCGVGRDFFLDKQNVGRWLGCGVSAPKNEFSHSRSSFVWKASSSGHTCSVLLLHAFCMPHCIIRKRSSWCWCHAQSLPGLQSPELHKPLFKN